MPRLTVWLTGAAVAGGLYLYALPTLNQEVNQYVETREHSVLAGDHAREREQALRVHQLYAALMSSVENERALDAALGRSCAAAAEPTLIHSTTAPHALVADDQWRSHSVFKTNKDILLFYCDIQRLRSLLLRLPARVQSAQETLRMWLAADVLEAQECGPTTFLHFRDEPLRWGQWWKCVLSFFCYCLAFRLIPLVWRRDGELRRRLLHTTAVHIADVLEIECEMTRSDITRSSTAEMDEEETAELTHTAPSSLPPRVHNIVLNTQHWIEEVGFWACENNPLLTTTPDAYRLLEGRGNLGRSLDAWCRRSAEDQSARQKLWHLQHGLLGAWCLYTRPTAAAVAESVPYELQWRARLQRTASHTGSEAAAEAAHGEVSPSSSVSHTEAALMAVVEKPVVTTTLGYPLTSDPIELARHSAFKVTQVTPVDAEAAEDVLASPPRTATLVPVGLAGLPRVLRVNALTSTPDVAPRRTKDQMYDYVYTEQYRRDPGQGPKAENNNSNRKSRDAREQLTHDEKRTFAALYEPRLRSGFVWWSPLWWGRVYGGRSQRGKATRRVLRYHVGRPCALDTYDLAQLDATVKATTEAYSTD